ncbi:MAG: hypothetical protein L6R36_002526 [Xanthoria steineri]|nr:MAG: hypothetical protein L6R36_002526 [Xanthoria steineri]
MELPEARSSKRKAESDHGPCRKKAHIAQCDPVEDSQELHLSSDDDSSFDSGSDSISYTPLTPLSSTASPRFPSELKTHLCTYKDCGRAFNRPAKLAEHVLSHTNSRPFVCPHKACTKDFLRKSHLSHHLKSAHSDVRDHVCQWPGCEKNFTTATRLKRHLAAHQGRTKHQCTVTGCGQTFRKHGTLQKHIAIVHEGRKPFSCYFQDQNGNVCKQGFDTAGKLRAHEGRVHGGQRFWCAICSVGNTDNDSSLQRGTAGTAGFSTYGELQQHIKTMHPPECSICGLVCSTHRELKSHVEVRHGTLSLDDRKTLICPEPGCGRAFTKKGNLNVHVEATHKSKKYVCGQVALESLNNVEGWDGHGACGRGLSTKASLQNHIRAVHMGMGRRRSKPTGKSRNDSPSNDRGTSSNLMKLTGAGYDKISSRHISCVMPDCDFRFGRAYDLRMHLTSHHDVPQGDAEKLLARAGRTMSPMSHEDDFPSGDAMQDMDAKDRSPMDIQGYEYIDDEAPAEHGWLWDGEEAYEDETRGEGEWFEDEREMRSLIGDDQSGVQGLDAMTIDPSLA